MLVISSVDKRPRPLLVDAAGQLITTGSGGGGASTQLPATLGTKTAANSLSITPASDAAFVQASTGYFAKVTTTRPANTTAYTAGDVVGGVITFPSMGPVAGHVVITAASLRYDTSALGTITSYRLYLYTATPASAFADNAAWDLPAGDRGAFAGYIDIPNMLDLGSTLFSQDRGINMQIKLASGESSVYGYLVTTNAFTPAANSEVLSTTLHAIGV